MPGLREQYRVDLAVCQRRERRAQRATDPHGFRADDRGGRTPVGVGYRRHHRGQPLLGRGNSRGGKGTVAHPKVLRPFNMPAGVPGSGVLQLSVSGSDFTVVNLMSKSAVAEPTPLFFRWLTEPQHVTPVWPAWQSIDQQRGSDRGFPWVEHLREAVEFAHAVDGTAAAVLGTHTHEPTLPLHLLPGHRAGHRCRDDRCHWRCHRYRSGALGGRRSAARTTAHCRLISWHRGRWPWVRCCSPSTEPAVPRSSGCSAELAAAIDIDRRAGDVAVAPAIPGPASASKLRKRPPRTRT